MAAAMGEGSPFEWQLRVGKTVPGNLSRIIKISTAATVRLSLIYLLRTNT